MLGQSLELVGRETRHVKGDAYALIVETTVQSAMYCETILVGDDTGSAWAFVFSGQGMFL